MREVQYDTVIIGGGPAGVAAGIKASSLGLRTLLLENRDVLGGIPLQCIHPGFGLHYFREDLTGTEFISRLLDRFENSGVDYVLKAYVHSIEYLDYDRKVVNAVTPQGVLRVYARTIIHATGARERHLFEIGIVGNRPDGVFTAGEAQALMDLYGVLPGKEVVIVGSGDVGLIMARRFALEGATVKAVVEIMPYPGGLMRNVVQCLYDFNIPLLLGHIVVSVVGKKRVEKVIVARVDENFKPIQGSEFEIPCDTVIVSAGLKPDVDLLEKIGAQIDPATGGPIVNEYLETTVPGVFVAGNALVINDLVDYAVEQGELAAEGAKMFIDDPSFRSKKRIRIVPGRNVRFVIPHFAGGEREVVLYARVLRPMRMTDIVVPELGIRWFSYGVRPAEMLRLPIKRDKLTSICSLEKLTLEVVPR